MIGSGIGAVRRFAPAILALFVLAGCSSAVRLRHPQTGQTVTCGSYYMVGFYSLAAAQKERGCVEDFQRQGYERVPE